MKPALLALKGSMKGAKRGWANSLCMSWDFIAIFLILGVFVPFYPERSEGARGSVRVRKLLAQPALSTTDRLSLAAPTLSLLKTGGFQLLRNSVFGVRRLDSAAI